MKYQFEVFFTILYSSADALKRGKIRIDLSFKTLGPPLAHSTQWQEGQQWTFSPTNEIGSENEASSEYVQSQPDMFDDDCTQYVAESDAKHELTVSKRIAENQL